MAKSKANRIRLEVYEDIKGCGYVVVLGENTNVTASIIAFSKEEKKVIDGIMKKAKSIMQGEVIRNFVKLADRER